jgi:MFS family permease
MFPVASLLSDGVIRQLLLANFLASIATGIGSILVPWVLVKEIGSDYFAFLASAITFFLIFTMPLIGRTIDCFKRKYVLIATSVCASLVFLTLSILERGSVVYAAMLLTIFVVMQVYYNIFYTARGALAQSLVERHNYGRLNGWLEIENQTAAFSAGTLAILLLDLLSVHTIFSVCMISLLCAGVVFAFIPEDERQMIKPIAVGPVRQPTFDRSLVLLALGGNMPFVCIMLLNIVKPIFISDVLLADAKVLAAASVCYTVGAVVSGGLSGQVMRRAGSFNTLVFAVWGFVISTALLLVFTHVYVLYVASLGWGIFNSLARISNQTIMMGMVENDIMGRFTAHVQKWTMFIRTGGVVGFSVIFLSVRYDYSFWYVCAIALIGPVLLWGRRVVVRE